MVNNVLIFAHAGKIGDKKMSEGNNTAKEATKTFLFYDRASEILKNSYNLVTTGKVYSAGLKSLIDISRGALTAIASLAVVQTAWNMIFNKGNSK